MALQMDDDITATTVTMTDINTDDDSVSSVASAASAAVRPSTSAAVPAKRDPCLPTTGPPVQYVDIFVDDFVGLGQQPTARRVRKTLLRAINHVFRPVGPNDLPFRREPVSVKNGS